MLNLFIASKNSLLFLGLFMENKTRNIYETELAESWISYRKRKDKFYYFTKFNKISKIPNKMITKFCYPEKL